MEKGKKKRKKKNLDCISHFADFAELGTYPKDEKLLEAFRQKNERIQNTSKGSLWPLF